jgi:hypothetical protein
MNPICFRCRGIVLPGGSAVAVTIREPSAVVPRRFVVCEECRDALVWFLATRPASLLAEAGR